MKETMNQVTSLNLQRLTVRLIPDLLFFIKEKAEKEGKSINLLMNEIIEDYKDGVQ